VELMGSPGKLAFPAVCARCGAPAGRRMRVEKVFSRSAGVHPTYVVLRADVPFCLPCTSKHRSEATGPPFGERVVSLFRSTLLIPAFVLAVVALVLLPRAIDRLGNDVNAALVFAAACAGLALAALLFLRGALRRTHRYRVTGPSSVTSAFDFTDDLSEMFERERHSYQLANRVFGDAFVAVNAARVWDGHHGRARDRGRSPVLLVSLAGVVAFLGWVGFSALRG
jgi:hypothetical protein